MTKRKTTVQILKDARALLVEKGWCRFELETGSGSLCAIGAINMAATGKSDEWGKNAPYKVLAAAFGEKLPLYAGQIETDPIADWNNARKRTKRQVLAAFSRAIKAEEAKRARAAP